MSDNTHLKADNAVLQAVNHPLTPIYHTNGEVLEGNWVGHALTEYRLWAGSYHGPHFLIHLGHMLDENDPHASVFRTKFVVRFPLEEGERDTDRWAKDRAAQMAETFLTMLNLRRTAWPPPP